MIEIFRSGLNEASVIRSWQKYDADIETNNRCHAQKRESRN